MLGIIGDTLVLYLAASLTKPIQPVLDSFAARTGTVIQRESGASLEHVRKLTELRRVPDVMLLADAEVFPQLLMPKYVSWYADVARNRIVVAYTRKSKHAAEITASNWTRILRASDVEVGRTDPNLAPVGYRALLMLQLAERYYKSPGLAKQLLARAPERNLRGNAAELAALLAAGELDYIYEYQSVAEANGFKYIQLPDAIDLGSAAHAAEYEKASITVRGAAPNSKLTYRGQPILYGFSIPRDASHAATAAKFYRYLFAPETIARLRAAHIDLLSRPVVHGTGAPNVRVGSDRND